MATEIFKLVGRIAYDGQQKVESGLKRIDKQVKKTEKSFQEFGRTAKKMGDGVKTAGENMTKFVSLPMAALGGIGLKTAADMEEAQGKIQASLGLTGEEAKNLNKVAENLWKNAFGENIMEASDAVATISKNMKYIPTDKLEEATEYAFILRDAFGAEIAESTKVADQLMAHFGLTAKQSFDLITKGYQEGLDFSGEWLDTLNEYAPQFSALGMSAEDMFNQLAAGADAGAFNLDKVGDAAKEFNIRIKDGSKTTSESMGQLSADTQKLWGEFQKGEKTGGEVMQAIITELAGMDDQVLASQIGVGLFGTQWEDLETDVINALGNGMDFLGDFEGATEQAGNALYDNFKTRAVEALRSLQSAFEPIGAVLLQMADNWLPKLNAAVDKLSNWFGSLTESQKKFVVILGLAAAAIGPLLVVVGVLISAIGTIVGAIGAIGLATVGWIAGIAALVVALGIAYAKVEWFREGVNQVFQFIANLVKPIIDDFVAFFKQKIAEMVAWWDKKGAMISQAFQNVWGVISTIIKVAIAILMPLVLGFINGVKNIISGGLKVITGIITAFAALFTGNWSALLDSIKQILSGALQLVWGLFEAGLLGRVFGIIKNFGIKGFNLFKSFGGKVTGFITQTATKIKSTFTSMVETVLIKVMYGFDKVKSAIMNPIRSAISFVSGQIGKLKSLFSSLQLKLPHIKLPHFSIKNWSINPKNWIKNPPRLAIDWYAKGGKFNGPSIIGVGEEPGVSEAVVPLKRPVFAEIGQGIVSAMQGMGGINTPLAGASGGPLVLNLMTPNKRIFASWILEDIDELLQKRSADAKRRKT